MSGVVPNTAEVDILTDFLTPDLSLRLYGNNATPAASSTAASFTEISGGGYAAKPLVLADWTITPADPTSADAALQQWDFTGPIGAPGTIYGYFVTRDSDGKLMWAERFDNAVIPFTPIDGSVVKVTPKITAQSVY